jgi:intraflagellar transport protein 52
MILFDRRGKNKKKLHRRLQSLAAIKTHDGTELSAALNDSDCELFVCFGEFQTDEDQAIILKDFIDRGGSVAVFSTEAESNINQFLDNFGIQIEEGAVVRAVYHKGYLHPKHALVQNGIVQPFGDRDERNYHGADGDTSTLMKFVYPNGTTLRVESPAFTLLSSGSTSYPVDCPVAAAWEALAGRGRLIAVGSGDIFSDEWLEREDNSKLCDVLFKFLLHQAVEFDPSLGRSDFEEKECVPDIASLSNLIKPCLQDVDPLPQDYTTLLCDDQFGFTMDHIPKVIDLYKNLNVNYDSLSLIEPHFNCPLPPLQMATHAPRMPELPPPELELFDLDECFTDIRTRLARLADKCSEDFDLVNYVRQAGWILGVDGGCRGDEDDEGKAKHVLLAVAKVILKAKMQQDESR